VGSRLGLVGKPAERGDALAFGAPREVEQATDVCERLLARRPDGEARVRARGGEESRDRVGEGPAIAVAVQVAQHGERIGDRRQLWWRLLGKSTERVQGAVALAPREERSVVEGEKRAAQRGEERQLVLGPLDGEEPAAQGPHLPA